MVTNNNVAFSALFFKHRQHRLIRPILLSGAQQTTLIKHNLGPVEDPELSEPQSKLEKAGVCLGGSGAPETRSSGDCG